MVAVVICVSVALVRERRDFGLVLRLGAFPAVLVGLFNGAANLLVMVIAGVMIPVFVFFPLISAGGLLISYLVSVFIFKERFGKMQKLGILLGIFALIFLNLELVLLH
jgi:drug/metabolite transporter (DMT)-like permease